MKNLQYLVSPMLLLSLGDEQLVYASSVNSIVFLVTAFVLVDEIERPRTVHFYLLVAVLVVFNPFYHVWLAVEPIRIVLCLAVSVYFLFKISTEKVPFMGPKQELKKVY